MLRIISNKTGRGRFLIVDHALLSSRKLANRARLAVQLHLREGVARVEDCQAKNSDEDHDAVESDKVGLGPHDGIRPASGHFANTEHTARENGHKRQGETGYEELEAKGRHECGGGGGKIGAVLGGAEGIV